MKFFNIRSILVRFQIVVVSLLLSFYCYSEVKNNPTNAVKILVLGISQDAGFPQLNCYQAHCMPAWQDASLKKMAVSLGVVDVLTQKKYLFEATPDIRQQMYNLHHFHDPHFKLEGIFLSHAHIGHYTGLMHLGHEAASSKGMTVYAMPRMKKFLQSNGPWSQLIDYNNIELSPLANASTVKLSKNLSVTPFLVPHRDEFSETVGFKITGPTKSALFIPDIDKWSKWNLDISKEISKVDYALIDATFYQNGEIPNRDMKNIPHPFVQESMQLLQPMSVQNKAKVIFIHFNHTNPLLQKDSKARQNVIKAGYKIAYEGMEIDL